MRNRRLLLPLLGLAAFAFLAFHYTRRGYVWCHPPRLVTTERERAEARTGLPGLEEVSFAGESGVTLRGWFSPPTNGTAIVYVHGLEGNRASLLPEAEVLCRHGYGALLFDARAHGESDGEVATWGYRESDDVRRATDFVLSRPSVKRVVLLGFSVGSSAVARAAAEDPRPVAIILYATWTSLHEELAYKLRLMAPIGRLPMELGYLLSGADVDQVKPIADVPRISPRPILFVEGLADADTPPPVMDRMFAAARDPKERLTVPGATHGTVFEQSPGEYERTVVDFLARATRQPFTAARFRP